jgi:hypothetical protein
LGSFIKIKSNGIQPLGITKNRMLSMDIDMETNLLLCRMQKFEKSKKAMDMDVPSAAEAEQKMFKAGLDYLVETDNALINDKHTTW